jgi:hypothetical protein
LPKSVHAGARKALNEIIMAEDRLHAEQAIQALVTDYGAKWPKAVAKITDDVEELLCFFDFPLLLICERSPGQREIGSICCSSLLAGLGRPKPWGKVERPQQREDERPCRRRGVPQDRERSSSSLRHAIGITVRRLVCWWGSPRAGVQPYLGARTRVRRHDG